MADPGRESGPRGFARVAVDRPAASPGVAQALKAFQDFAADRPGVLVAAALLSALFVGFGIFLFMRYWIRSRS